MTDNLLITVEAEATRRNHEVIARVLRAAREEQERTYLNNPGCDQPAQVYEDRLDMLIYGGD